MDKSSFRISVDDSYTEAIGRAVYNFAYLEWAVVWIIEKIEKGYLQKASNKTAGQIAKDLEKISKMRSLGQPSDDLLKTLSENFSLLVVERNKLVHGNPFSDENGEQRLNYNNNGTYTDWKKERIYNTAKKFDILCIGAINILNNHLPKK